MSDSKEILISVNNISKLYRIWQSPTARLGSAGLEFISSLIPKRSRIHNRLQARNNTYFNDFPALKNISFQVTRGEAIGIVGRNGSGKSTLLQIIAGTTKATEGDVTVTGRIAALLELGSAFHPQFTGRDNVYLNCAIMGIDKPTTDDLFEEIAAFAEIGDFMEQPVRMYSSGMETRLAFSVQVVLQPDILIVDEALAVGDTYFQAKCYRRIREMLENDVTLLFVSHSTNIVRELCDRVILLNDGDLILDDKPGPVLDRYFQLDVELNSQKRSAIESINITRQKNTDTSEKNKSSILQADSIHPDIMQGRGLFDNKAREHRINDSRAKILNIQLVDVDGKLQQSFSYGSAVRLRILIQFNENIISPMIAYQIITVSGIRLVHFDTRYSNNAPEKYFAGEKYLIEWELNLHLQHGQYYIRSVLSMPPCSENNEWDYIDIVPHAYDFSVSAHPKGMLGALVSLDSDLNVYQLDGVIE